MRMWSDSRLRRHVTGAAPQVDHSFRKPASPKMKGLTSIHSCARKEKTRQVRLAACARITPTMPDADSEANSSVQRTRFSLLQEKR